MYIFIHSLQKQSELRGVTASQKNLFSLLGVMGSGINVYVRKIAWCTTKTISFSNQKQNKFISATLCLRLKTKQAQFLPQIALKRRRYKRNCESLFSYFSQILLKWLRILHKTQIQIQKLIFKPELFIIIIITIIIIIIIIIIVIVNSEHYYHWIIIFLSFMLLV